MNAASASWLHEMLCYGSACRRKSINHHTTSGDHCVVASAKDTLILPVDVIDVRIGDDDAVPASLQASGEPQRVQVVLVDDVPDGVLPQQLLPPQPGGGAYICTEGDVTGLPRRLVVAILQNVTVLIHGYDSSEDRLICGLTEGEKKQRKKEYDRL